MFEQFRGIIGLGSPQETTKNLQMQAQRLAILGFHIELGMTVTEYYAEMPQFQLQPAEFRGRFPIPLLVDPRVSLLRQLQLHFLPIETSVTEAEIVRLSLREVQKPYIPSTLYQIWVRAGGSNRSIDDFAKDERGLTLIEGMALLRERSRLFRFKTHGTVGQLDVIPIDHTKIKKVDAVSTEEIICADTFWNENIVATLYRCRFAAGPKMELWVGRRYLKPNSRSRSNLVPTVGKQVA